MRAEGSGGNNVASGHGGKGKSKGKPLGNTTSGSGQSTGDEKHRNEEAMKLKAEELKERLRKSSLCKNDRPVLHVSDSTSDLQTVIPSSTPVTAYAGNAAATIIESGLGRSKPDGDELVARVPPGNILPSGVNSRTPPAPPGVEVSIATPSPASDMIECNPAPGDKTAHSLLPSPEASATSVPRGVRSKESILAAGNRPPIPVRLEQVNDARPPVAVGTTRPLAPPPPAANSQRPSMVIPAVTPAAVPVTGGAAGKQRVNDKMNTIRQPPSSAVVGTSSEDQQRQPQVPSAVQQQNSMQESSSSSPPPQPAAKRLPSNAQRPPSAQTAPTTFGRTLSNGAKQNILVNSVLEKKSDSATEGLTNAGSSAVPGNRMLNAGSARLPGEAAAARDSASTAGASQTLKIPTGSFAQLPARKKPKLANGEMDAWQAEYKFLRKYLDDKFPASLPATVSEPYTEDKLREVQKYLESRIPDLMGDSLK